MVDDGQLSCHNMLFAFQSVWVQYASTIFYFRYFSIKCFRTTTGTSLENEWKKTVVWSLLLLKFLIPDIEIIRRRYLAVDANKAVKISNIRVSVIFNQTEWVVIIKRTVCALIKFSISHNIVTATKLGWIHNKQNHR